MSSTPSPAPADEGRSAHPLPRRFESEFLRPYRGAILMGLLGLLVQSLLLLPIPLLQGLVVDRLVEYYRVEETSGSPENSARNGHLADDLPPFAKRFPRTETSVARVIVLVLVATIALQLLRAVVAWKVAAMMGRISQEVVVALRGALHRKLMRLPMAYFDAQQTGRLMARVTSDVGSILMFIRSGILQVLNDLILSVAIAILLGWLQWRLALIVLVTVPLYGLNQRYFFGILRRLSDEILRTGLIALCPLERAGLSREGCAQFRQGGR